MESSDLLPAVEEINGINLNNYFLYKRDFNSFVYIHKKFLNSHRANTKEPLPKKENRKRHRSQQTDDRDINCKKLTNRNGSVLEQTINFAKKLIPLTIPPSRDKSPVCYTIKTSKSSRKKAKRESSLEQDIIYDKERSKTVTRTYRKEKTRNRSENLIVKDSYSQSSESNTLDDININQSLSCTFSEVSQDKYLTKEINSKRKRDESKKFVVSESFEAVAAEKVSDGAGIKIHLMNEADKKMLTDNIRIPVLNTIQDCLKQINNTDIKTDIGAVERCLLSNAYKLDMIIQKISRIEKTLEVEREGKYFPRKQMKDKTSILESLEEDIIEDDISCSEEESQYPTGIETKNNVVEYLMKEKNMSKLGCGEAGTVKTCSSVGVKTDLPTRLPTRFCWTDTVMKNLD